MFERGVMRITTGTQGRKPYAVCQRYRVHGVGIEVELAVVVQGHLDTWVCSVK
jgi:hypothetical protein